jgi:hypothetical protein
MFLLQAGAGARVVRESWGAPNYKAQKKLQALTILNIFRFIEFSHFVLFAGG